MIRPKNIVIIGGGSGIGLATAKKVLMDTSVKNVIISSRSLEKLNCAKEHLNYDFLKGRFHYYLLKEF